MKKHDTGRIPPVIWSLLLILMVSGAMVHAQTGAADLDFARKLYDDGLYLLAADQYQEYVRHHPESSLASQAYFMVAESYFAQGDLEAAEGGYRDFLRQYPQDPLAPEAWFHLGECLLQLDRLTEAIAAYERSRQMAPQGQWASQAQLGLARALLGDDQLLPALDELEIFIGQYPQDASLYDVQMIRGEILAKLGRLDEAAAAYQEAVRKARTGGERSRAGYRQSRILIRHGDDDAAVDMLSGLVRVDSTSIFADSALILLGDLYVAGGQYELAARTYGLLSDRGSDPTLAERGGLRRAEALKSSDDPETALTTYRQWLNDHPDSPLRAKAQLGMVAIFQEGGVLDSAAVLLEQLARGIGDESWGIDVWLQLADLQRQMGHGERALTTYRGFLSRFPKAPQCDSITYLMARMQEEDLNRPQAALRTYRDLSAKEPTGRWAERAAFAVGRLLETGGKYEEARQAYQAFAQEHPQSSLYPRAQERIRYLSDFRIPEEPLALEAMVDIQDQLASGILTEEEVDLRLADIYFRHLRNFDRAAAALERFLDRHAGSTLTDEALYQLSRCHAMKAEMLRIDGDLSGAEQEREAAVRACRRLLRDRPDSQWADECALRVIADILREAESAGTPAWRDRRELYVSFLQTYPASQWQPLALLRVGQALRETSEGDSLMLAKADSVFSLVATGHAQSAWADSATWYRIAIARHLKGDQAALTAGQDFLWDFPDSPLRSRVFFLQAEIHERRGDHRQAAQLFQSVAEDFAYHDLTERAWLREAQSLWAADDHQEAERVLEAFTRSYPVSQWRIRATLLRAQYAAAGGRADQSRALLAEVEKDLKREALDPSEQLALGDIYRQLGDFKQALTRYQTVMDGQGDQPLALEALKRMAAASFEAGDYGKAEDFYERALAGNVDESDRSLLDSRRVLCLYRQGLVQEAVKARKEFERTYPHEADQASELLLEEAQAYQEDEDEKTARKALERVLSNYPESAKVQEAEYRLGLMSLSAGRYEEALEQFSALLKRYPGSDLEDVILFKMGSALYGLEQYPDAAQHYLQAAERTGDDALKADALFNAAICRARMNDWNGAISAYRRLLDDFPRHRDGQTWSLRLGFAYLESGQAARALETFVGIDPGSDRELGAELQFWIGECYFKMGRFERAAQEYLRVGFLYPQQVQWATTAEYNAGVSYEKLGRTEEARTIYQRLIQTQGTDGQWGRMAQERLQQLEE